jgi:hypothetical protein
VAGQARIGLFLVGEFSAKANGSNRLHPRQTSAIAAPAARIHETDPLATNSTASNRHPL